MEYEKEPWITPFSGLYRSVSQSGPDGTQSTGPRPCQGSLSSSCRSGAEMTVTVSPVPSPR
ncbi:hypothetical protein [Aminivibrio sp.]|uniref:hypothetical protein n=1 Tax=Aminivibrio sp. TaxID=1872489 RepID=UPI003D958189